MRVNVLGGNVAGISGAVVISEQIVRKMSYVC